MGPTLQWVTPPASRSTRDLWPNSGRKSKVLRDPVAHICSQPLAMFRAPPAASTGEACAGLPRWTAGSARLRCREHQQPTAEGTALAQRLHEHVAANQGVG